MNVHALNNQSCKIHEAKLLVLKREIGKSTIIAGDCNPLSVMYRMRRQKSSKDIQHLNNVTTSLTCLT